MRRLATGRWRRWLGPIVLGTFCWLLSSAATAQFCTGDCDRDGSVTAGDLVSVLKSECSAGAPDLEVVDVAELGTVIANVFSDCNGPPADWQVAFDASEIGYMMSGWGPGDGSFWVVGGQLENGAVLHYEGDEWTEVDIGFPVPLLNWVHGTSANDVFVGGNDAFILHYDGVSWSRHFLPVDDPVWGLWAVAPDDVWAVGGDGVFGIEPFVIHYDGQAWSRASIPTIVRPGVSALFKVWGASADDIYTVGQNGAVLHWDGAAFTELGVGISQDLIGIWGNGSDDITVVGGRGTAEFAHFDGATWTRAPASSMVGLNGVWTRRPEVAHVVGVLGTVLRIDPRTLEVLEQDFVPTTLELHAVFGDDSGHLFAFGANFNLPERGIVLIRKLSDDD